MAFAFGLANTSLKHNRFIAQFVKFADCKIKKLGINQRWADKQYKKSHLGNEWKKPFAGSSHAKGIVLEKM